MSGPYVKDGYNTMKEHMPSAQHYYAEWNPARFIQKAGKIGQATSQLVERILTTRPYPEQGLRGLFRDYPAGTALRSGTCRSSGKTGSPV
jgi:hypothetical protein